MEADMTYCPHCQALQPTATVRAYQDCRQHRGCAIEVETTTCAQCQQPLAANTSHLSYAKAKR